MMNYSTLNKCSSYEEYIELWYVWFKEFTKTTRYPTSQSWKIWRQRFETNNVKNLYARTKRLVKLPPRGITKYRLFLQYGKKLGLEKWGNYCNLQAYTNSREYKRMNKEEFKNYNKSRAVTLELLIKRHGEELGTKKWDEYIQRQKYTKSKQRYIDEFGEEEGTKLFKEINNKKKNTLDNYIQKFGQIEGIKKFENYIKKLHNRYYSQEASELFYKLESLLNKEQCFFKPKTEELVLYDLDENRSFFYDFYNKEYRILIEYNGSLFHGNPKLYEARDTPNPFDKTLTSEKIWRRDSIKRDIALKKDYRLIVLWDTYAKEHKQTIVNDLYNIICGNERFVELI